MQSSLDEISLSAHIRDDVYAEGITTHAHFLLSAWYESFASWSQLKNVFKNNLYTLYATSFPLIGEPCVVHMICSFFYLINHYS